MTSFIVLYHTEDSKVVLFDRNYWTDTAREARETFCNNNPECIVITVIEDHG